ncbi:hypothetical protein P7K49_024865 [Saguinus oedipus]|uniref:Uncharacterized protein n=1 Tax=Saguinus oedipus TaxID=9490 RepID=A0ABQ9UFK1_SAGOE|nr:hypothetical protein P7K49_024865 [Saguinus oedipus]
MDNLSDAATISAVPRGDEYVPRHEGFADERAASPGWAELKTDSNCSSQYLHQVDFGSLLSHILSTILL